jgi:hypothetical protein
MVPVVQQMGADCACHVNLNAQRSASLTDLSTGLATGAFKNGILRVSLLKKKKDARARAAWALCGFESRQNPIFNADDASDIDLTDAATEQVSSVAMRIHQTAILLGLLLATSGLWGGDNPS